MLIYLSSVQPNSFFQRAVTSDFLAWEIQKGTYSYSILEEHSVKTRYKILLSRKSQKELLPLLQ